MYQDCGDFLLRHCGMFDAAEAYRKDRGTSAEVACELARRLDDRAVSIPAFSHEVPMRVFPPLGLLVAGGSLGGLTFLFSTSPAKWGDEVTEWHTAFTVLSLLLLVATGALAILRQARFKVMVAGRLRNRECFHCGYPCSHGDEPLGTRIMCSECGAKNLVFRASPGQDAPDDVVPSPHP